MLTKIEIDQAKPREKSYKLNAEKGLYLIINPNGSRWWRIKYRFGGKEKLLSLGTYPKASLKQARDRRDDAKKQIANSIDPSAKRKSEKVARADSFEAIGREWLALKAKELSPVTLKKNTWMLEDFVFPTLGSRPVSKITAPDLLPVLRCLETRGKHETTHRTKQTVGQVMRYAIATGRAERDITADLKGALVSKTVKNHAAIAEPAKVGALMRAIDGYQGQPGTLYALKLAPLLFVRPGELRAAAWTEFDLERPEWRIPAGRMKMGDEHLVPLATQAIALIEELKPLTGSGACLFPALTTKARPMSENDITAALRRMGYTGAEKTRDLSVGPALAGLLRMPYLEAAARMYSRHSTMSSRFLVSASTPSYPSDPDY